MMRMVVQCQKTLHINDFKWVEDTSEFDESFGKRYNEEGDKGHFL